MKFISIFLLAGALLSASPVSTSSVATLVSAGSPLLASNGDYVGPYGLTLNQNLYPALCVDDKDWGSLNAPWNVNVTSISSGNFSLTYNPTEGQEYMEDAWIYNQITQPGADRINLQHAAWDIMDLGITTSTQLTNDLSSSDGAYNFISQALTGYSSMNFSGYEILSDCNKGDGPGDGREQEFIICTPEPASFMLLGMGLLLAGVGSARQRRKQLTNSTVS